MANRIYTAARHGPADIPGDTVRIEIGLDNECGKLVFFDEYDQSGANVRRAEKANTILRSLYVVVPTKSTANWLRLNQYTTKPQRS
ncbi:hypothetical protein SADO_16868 [Salinisphaera dokdonensis CL-ES53]|jgi:hypothetical protein|uniref:Uncharacterized protein n=2 Tax=Salinisphaera TaxID=180541 RepID=A0ABV7EMI5_9GAMM|nr:hypothetical protein [Salinisphaera sp.]MBS61877.1 hypothetical protein [Salinisphaera sp.]